MIVTPPVAMAWAAGLYEGEGTIFYYEKKTSVNMRLVSTDEDVVRRFHEIVGVGGFYVKKKTSGFGIKTQYVWAAGAINDVIHVAKMILPYMCTRRRQQILDALDAYNTATVNRRPEWRKELALKGG